MVVYTLREGEVRVRLSALRHMTVFVKAKPKAKEEKIEKVDETHFVVCVKEPPIKGEANQAIARILARYFKVPFSSVSLVSGFTSKEKIFRIGN